MYTLYCYNYYVYTVLFEYYVYTVLYIMYTLCIILYCYYIMYVRTVLLVYYVYTILLYSVYCIVIICVNSVRETRQWKGTAPEDSYFYIERMSCLGWDLILWHTARRADALPTELWYMYMYVHC